MFAAANLAAAAAAWRQHGVSGGSTINNQLKAWAAMAMETATMIATTMTRSMLQEPRSNQGPRCYPSILYLPITYKLKTS